MDSVWKLPAVWSLLWTYPFRYLLYAFYCLIDRSVCTPGFRIVGPSNGLHLTLVLSLLLVRHSDKSSIGDKASPAARNSSEVAGTYGA